MRRLLVTVLVLWPAAGQGQAAGHPEPGPGPVRDRVAAAVVPDPVASLDAAPALELARSPAGAFTASLLLPGAGQAALGLRRWVAYAALEAAFWTVHLEAAADVRRLSDAYRDLAWQTARLPTGPGERRDGSWGYYETMGEYVTSGRWDRDPGAGGLQPETDPGTYNGAIWSLALGIYLPGGTVDPTAPEYEAALAYYRDRAAGPDFLWDWTGRLDALERYQGLISDADDEARVRSAALGLVLANHLVAAVDALVVARLRDGVGPRLESRLVTSPRPRLDIGMTLPLRN